MEQSTRDFNGIMFWFLLETIAVAKFADRSTPGGVRPPDLRYRVLLAKQTWNWVIGSPGHHFDPV